MTRFEHFVQQRGAALCCRLCGEGPFGAKRIRCLLVPNYECFKREAMLTYNMTEERFKEWAREEATFETACLEKARKAVCGGGAK